jgi:hypothetical protein
MPIIKAHRRESAVHAGKAKVVIHGVSVPASVFAERDRALGAPRSPNQEVLGDPLPGRAALDRRGSQ